MWALLFGSSDLGVALPQGFLDGGPGGLIGLGDGRPAAQLVAENRVKGRGQLPTHRVVLINEQAVKERQVELPPHGIRGFAISRLAIPDSPQGAFEVGLSPLEVGGNLRQAPLDGGQLGSDAPLLALEQVERHRFGQMCVQQRRPFGFELALAAFLGRPFVLGSEPEVGQFFFQEGPERHQFILRKLHRGVVGGDGFLDQLDAEGALGAAVLVLLAANADEVRIDTAVATLGIVDD